MKAAYINSFGGPEQILYGDKVAVLNATGCGSHAEYSCSKEQYAIKCAWHAQAIRSFSFHVYDNKRKKRLANAAKCFDMIRDGRVKPYVCKDFPLAEAKAAHELLDSGKAIGKIIMHP